MKSWMKTNFIRISNQERKKFVNLKKNATLYQIGIVISPILINFILWKKL